MRALVFGVPPEPFEVLDDANTLTRNLAHSPVGLRNVPDPQPLHDDWVITRHYLELAADGRVNLRPMLTHTFGLEQWREAFLAIANQGESGAVKVAIDYR
ncbi:MAG: hypothetical protein QOC90_968 [Mycobacterium sp.]|jgi:hypothetical protein|nr:hypothetical protein [Mycobacterium sp.]